MWSSNCLSIDAGRRERVTLNAMVSSRLTAGERAKVFKALSDPTRVAIVDVLAKSGPQCGTELADQLGISIALVSHHWEVLVEAGLVRKERVGQARYCTVDLARIREATGGWDDVTLSLATPKPPKAKAKTKTRPKTKNERR